MSLFRVSSRRCLDLQVRCSIRVAFDISRGLNIDRLAFSLQKKKKKKFEQCALALATVISFRFLADFQPTFHQKSLARDYITHDTSHPSTTAKGGEKSLGVKWVFCTRLVSAIFYFFHATRAIPRDVYVADEYSREKKRGDP